MNIDEERLELLKTAVEQRKRGVMHYQINIDNFRAAIVEIETNHKGDEALVLFLEQLKSDLAATLVEQAKEKIMLTVIERQLV